MFFYKLQNSTSSINLLDCYVLEGGVVLGDEGGVGGRGYYGLKLFSCGDGDGGG